MPQSNAIVVAPTVVVSSGLATGPSVIITIGGLVAPSSVVGGGPVTLGVEPIGTMICSRTIM